MTQYYSQSTRFFGQSSPEELLAAYGSPLYVYNESILRQRCREIADLVSYRPFWADYSCKANTNLSLLRIIREEGLHADAMSPGEIHTLLAAGFGPEEILFVCNNVSAEEMAFAVERGILVSMDSVSQMELYGENFPGTSVAVRLNPGIGIGHHDKVITAGKQTKFGINEEYIPQIMALAEKYDLKIIGLNQHLGSLFMEESNYMRGVEALLRLCVRFPDLEFVDLGGGFGIPYHKQNGEAPLNLAPLRAKLDTLMEKFITEYGRRVTFRIEPGRYIVAECGAVLGRVHSVKENAGITYVGTDIGFNVLQRPIMYDSHHDIEVFRDNVPLSDAPTRPQTLVGNICESGDKLATERDLPGLKRGDIVAAMDAGAYGYSMSSNYNHRLRPAEVLIGLDGQPRLIRRRDTLEDLMRGFVEE